MLTNLGKIAICMAMCYLPYYLVFRKYTFFTLNRWYLLSSLVVSLLIPFIHIKTNTSASFNRILSIEEIRETGAIIVNILVPPKHASINWLLIIQGVCWIVAAALAIRLLFTISLLLRKAAKHGITVNGQRVVYQHSGHNSSFFNIIFLDVDGLTTDEQQTILAHEQAHVRLGHSVDNLFTAVLKVIFWFNPFVYLMAASLRQTHEFEVDALITSKQNPKTYAGLLYKMAVCYRLQVLNQFSSGSLKSRVNMLFKSKTNGHRKLQYIVALLFLSIFSLGFIIEDKIMTGRLPHIENLLLHQIAKPSQPATSTFQVSKPLSLPSTKLNITHVLKRSDVTKDTIRIKAWATDSTYVDAENRITYLYGDAHIIYGKMKFIGEYARIDENKHTIFVRKVRLEEVDLLNKTHVIEADSVVFNTETKRALSYSTVKFKDLPQKP